MTSEASKDILVTLVMKPPGDFFAFLCSVREQVAASDSVHILCFTDLQPGSHRWVTLRSLLFAVGGTLKFHFLCCNIWFKVCACAMSWHVF